MRRLHQVIAATVLCCASAATNATVLQTWDLTNKSPGALGPDYGLRLNQIDEVGLEPESLIFDFEHSDSDVNLQLVNYGGGLQLLLSGTAYGARFDESGYLLDGSGYGTTDVASDPFYEGLYELIFTWNNVQQNTVDWDFVAELGIDSKKMGDGSGTVRGLDTDTAFMGTDILTIYDWSGKYNHTLDVLGTNSPNASGWLTYGDGHNGDYGFNMIAVPEPGTLGLLGAGLLGLGVIRRKRAT